MKKQWISFVLILSLILSMQITVRGELGDDLGATWETDTFGANITFYHAKQGDYALGEDFIFLSDTYCSGAKNTVGQRELSVKPYIGSSKTGIGSIQYKDDNVWKDISEYNTQVSFRNDVDREFKIVFLKEGTYVLNIAFLSDDHTVFVGCRTRYITIKDGKYSIGFDAPPVQELFVEGYQISAVHEGFQVIAGVEDTVQNQKVKSKGFIFGLTSIGGTTDLGVQEEDMTVDSESYYIYPVEATEEADISFEGTSSSASYYAMTMRFGVCNVSAFTSIYAVRSYVELEDGTYVYSDVYRFSVFDIAKKLYEESMMYTLEAHNYLYEKVLTVVLPSYEEKEYSNQNGVVSPDFYEEGV
ncbi:MAG: hypothetical protein K6G64_05770 [Eubacterium sp.]|nr:hypothetical protein [Eubacterium sp.]